MSAATLRRVGGLRGLSSSLVSGMTGVFAVSSPPPPPDPDPRLSVAAAETVLRTALVKIVKTLISKKYKAVRDEAQKQLDLLETIVASSKADDPATSARRDRTASADWSIEGATAEAPTAATPSDSNHVALKSGRHLGIRLQKYACEFFQPFKMACETGSSRAILVSLDGLQVFIQLDCIHSVLLVCIPSS